MSNRLQYQFGLFCLDASEQRLTRDGSPVPLPPKAFDTLHVLVKNGGELVTKQTLMESVWPESFVEEANLTVAISHLRRTLGDADPNGRFIETVPRRGYRFLPEVREVEAPSRPAVIHVATLEERTRSHVVVEETVETDPPSDATAIRRYAIAGVALAVVIAAMFAYGRWSGPAEARRNRSAVFPGTSNSEAHALVLQGRFFWNKRTSAGLVKAIDLYKNAMGRDPDYALAYVGLADAYAFDLYKWPEAEELARKTMALDPSLGEPHATLGFISTFWKWDWEGAEREFRQAIELSPDYATAHQWYAIHLALRGRLDEADAEMRKAEELDPVSLSIAADTAQMAYFRRDYPVAIERCERAFELDKSFVNTPLYVYRAYRQQGLTAEAVRTLSRYQLFIGMSDAFVDEARKRFHEAGPEAFWKYQLEQLDRDPEPDGVKHAEIQLQLGDRDGALKSLEQACANREFDIVFVKADPLYDPIRDNPRFAEIVRRVGLEP